MYKWHFRRWGGVKQVVITRDEDLLHLRELDRTLWSALSIPINGLRFDMPTLERLDADHDGHIHRDDILAAVDRLLAGKGEDRERIMTLLRNTLNQADLYEKDHVPIYLTGTFYADGRAFPLCFHVVDEEAHSALAEKSACCIVYLKLTRKGTGDEPETASTCAVITKGRTAPLYVGRNGLFCDRDGCDWDAVVTRVVEAQVSLAEAFWAPWRKMATTVAEQIRSFMTAKQTNAVAAVSKVATATTSVAPAVGGTTNAAALASSVAALGVGIGMMGAAFAGLIGLVAGLPWWKTALAVVTLILGVSLPSVILTWFKLHRRDLGAVLNACGWAVNRKIGVRN